mmetsp:Transcript_6986/g.11579  ORF Transcript_6986/g.11579 Transcript_6986/m.11579 type:complete len:204 (-) Transcript_6986:13-624(-)
MTTIIILYIYLKKLNKRAIGITRDLHHVQDETNHLGHVQCHIHHSRSADGVGLHDVLPPLADYLTTGVLEALLYLLLLCPLLLARWRHAAFLSVQVPGQAAYTHGHILVHFFQPSLYPQFHRLHSLPTNLKWVWNLVLVGSWASLHHSCLVHTPLYRLHQHPKGHQTHPSICALSPSNQAHQIHFSMTLHLSLLQLEGLDYSS